VIAIRFGARITKSEAISEVKLHGHPVKTGRHAGASRKRNIVLIVPLNPAYKAGLRGTCRSTQPRRVLMIPRKYFGKGSKDVR
jgi:hypothetical protein